MTSPATVNLIFAGGGTGGHLFPAIAIADRVRELLSRETAVKILFVGTKRGIEYRLRDSLGYPLRLINVRGLARSFTLKNLLVPFLLAGALWESRSILREWRPDIVVGTGGYVCWPVLRMAAARGIPTVLQEQNSFPGITTRRLASRARRVYLGFESARSFLAPSAPIVVSGNPVRAGVAGGSRAEALAHFGLVAERKTILVLGGSQGARAINEAVLKSLAAGSLPPSYQLLWQAGKDHLDSVTAALGDTARRHRIVAFEQRMDLVYAAADLAVARAGAITLAELEACRVPALLVPYPYAAGDHQRHNARAYAAQGMAEVIDPNELDRCDLLGRAVALFENGRADQMKAALQTQAATRRPAVDIIAEDIIALIKQGRLGREATVDR